MVMVFDLDGVVYLGTTPIPGASQALNELAGEGHRLFFLTNNSTRSRKDYADRITAMGHEVRPEQVMTSAYATALHLKAAGAAGKKVFVVGEFGLEAEMADIGLIVVEMEDA